MSNIQISVDLLALKGAFVEQRTGQDGVSHSCIVIATDVANLGCWISDDGSKRKAFLNVVAWESREKKYDNTHYVKQSFPKDVTDAMTEEQKKAIPIIGNGKEIAVKKPAISNSFASVPPIGADPRVQGFAQAVGATPVNTPTFGQDDGKLPF